MSSHPCFVIYASANCDAIEFLFLALPTSILGLFKNPMKDTTND